MRFSVPSEEGKEPSCYCWGGHAIVLSDWAVLKSWL